MSESVWKAWAKTQTQDEQGEGEMTTFDINKYLVPRDSEVKMRECMSAVIAAFYKNKMMACGYCEDLTNTGGFNGEASSVVRNAVEKHMGDDISIETVDLSNYTFSYFIDEILYGTEERFERESLEPMFKNKEDKQFPPWSGEKIRYIVNNNATKSKQTNDVGVKPNDWNYLNNDWCVDVFIKENRSLYERKDAEHKKYIENVTTEFITDMASEFKVSKDVVRDAMTECDYSVYDAKSMNKVVDVVKFAAKYVNNK